jgi:tRNA uridine 5-carboxymethylaminomethyl modification enzyme
MSSKADRIKIPADLDYSKIRQISTETKEKLEKIKPVTLGQASRIGGVKPADIAVLSVLIDSKAYRNME